MVQAGSNTATGLPVVSGSNVHQAKPCGARERNGVWSLLCPGRSAPALEQSGISRER